MVLFIVVKLLSRDQLCNPTDCSTPGFPALHYLREFGQTHVHRVNDVIQPSHPLSPPSPFALNLSQHQDLCQRVRFSHQIVKVLESQHQQLQELQGQFSFQSQGKAMPKNVQSTAQLHSFHTLESNAQNSPR